MKKLLKLFIILNFIVSCSSLNISKQKAYQLNSNYVKKIYNVEVDEDQVGVYLNGKEFQFFSLIGDDIYKIIMDKEGNLISNDKRPAFPY